MKLSNLTTYQSEYSVIVSHYCYYSRHIYCTPNCYSYAVQMLFIRLYRTHFSLVLEIVFVTIFVEVNIGLIKHYHQT